MPLERMRWGAFQNVDGRSGTVSIAMTFDGSGAAMMECSVCLQAAYAAVQISTATQETALRAVSISSHAMTALL